MGVGGGSSRGGRVLIESMLFLIKRTTSHQLLTKYNFLKQESLNEMFRFCHEFVWRGGGGGGGG